MINFIASTKGQPDDHIKLGNGMGSPSYPRSKDQDIASSSVRDSHTVERFTDGSIVIKVHKCKD
jgi:hypothetical protein